MTFWRLWILDPVVDLLYKILFTIGERISRSNPAIANQVSKQQHLEHKKIGNDNEEQWWEVSRYSCINICTLCAVCIKLDVLQLVFSALACDTSANSALCNSPKKIRHWKADVPSLFSTCRADPHESRCRIDYIYLIPCFTFQRQLPLFSPFGTKQRSKTPKTFFCTLARLLQ